MGNAVNDQASDTVGDQVIRHDNYSSVFQSANLNAHVEFDGKNAVLATPNPNRRQIFACRPHTRP